MFNGQFIDQVIIDAVFAANQKYHQANLDIFKIWKSHMLFKWFWWVELALTILPWILWFIVRKKESTHRLLYGGFVVLILTAFLDMLGMSLGLWGYNANLLPIIPPYIPWDFTLMPVVAMLFYQYKPNANPFIKAIIFSAIASFVIQPFFAWIGFYNPQDWKHEYSFPIIIAIYLIGFIFTRARDFQDYRL